MVQRNNFFFFFAFSFLKSKVLNDTKQLQYHAVRMQPVLLLFIIQSKRQMPFTIPLFLNHEDIFKFIITFKDAPNDLTLSSNEDSIK